MAHDIVIRGGEVVDGTGSEARVADVAIDQGRISAVGKLDQGGREEIDATGQVVTPGFVDIHTHLDAQIGWDPDLTPVSWHGVTSVLMGNCGVTFAPCKAGDRELLASMMETVEDIPREAILGGLPWDWEDYGGYLDAVERLRPGLNVAGLVGHCAVRFYVMGERAVEEQASHDEKRQMAEIVARSIDRGAVGFSTNRFPAHVLPDGRSIPGTFAEADELLEIAKVVGPRRALMQNVLDFTQFEFTKDLLRSLAQTTDGRVLFSFGSGASRESGRNAARVLEEVCEGGLDITAITQPRGSGFLFGLQGMLPGRGASWKRLAALDLEGRIAAIHDEGTCAALVADAQRKRDQPLPVQQVFWMGTETPPDYQAGEAQSLRALAEAAGEHWSETFLRMSRETQGKGLFTYRMFNQNLEALEDLLSSDRVFPSLGDAGAHVSQIMDAGWATFVLAYWVRERGLYTLGEAIRRLTSAPARIIGMRDRGTLAPGMAADLNVFDPQTVAECQPEVVHDFPGGAPRLIQRSQGYRATIVNGRINVLEGQHSGVHAGEILRHSA